MLLLGDLLHRADRPDGGGTVPRRPRDLRDRRELRLDAGHKRLLARRAVEVVVALAHAGELQRLVAVEVELRAVGEGLQAAGPRAEEAELMADCKITEVYTGIAGSHIKSINSRGMVAIKDREVTEQDVARVIETAKAIPIPTDQQVLHILNQEFIVDGQGDVREPLGMSGVRLEVNVHIVTGAVSAAQNIIKCVRRCGLEVRDLILQPLAASPILRSCFRAYGGSVSPRR